MNLALLFTRSVSLDKWASSGLFEREKLIYEKHLKLNNFDYIYWFTYGVHDNKLASRLYSEKRLNERVRIIGMPRLFNFKIGVYLYSFLLPFIHSQTVRKCDFIKTNQMDGSWTAVIAKWIFNKKLVVRTGFILSQLENRLKRKSYFKLKIIELLEKVAYKSADICVVTAEHNRNYITGKYNIPREKIRIIYNYIDTDLFRPDKSIVKYKDRIVYVGRLSEEKNLFNLISAISETKLTLDIYGAGPLIYKLKQFAKNINAKVNFNGIVQNSMLPDILNKYIFFILPSLFEGMPKTLLEAMGCGLICIGTDVVGINEVIEHNKNGILVFGTDTNNIRQTIESTVNSEYKEISVAATINIKDKFALKVIAEKEKKLFKIV